MMPFILQKRIFLYAKFLFYIMLHVKSYYVICRGFHSVVVSALWLCFPFWQGFCVGQYKSKLSFFHFFLKNDHTFRRASTIKGVRKTRKCTDGESFVKNARER